MGRANTEHGESIYYPPRARWYGRALYPWFRLQSRLGLERIHFPGGVSLTEFLLSVVIPGFSLANDGRWILGASFLAVWCASILVAFAALGYSAANVAVIIAVVTHGLSVFYLHRDRLREFGFSQRFGIAFLFVLLVGIAYVPVGIYCSRHWVIPLQLNKQVVVIDTRSGARSGSFESGDWMAYSYKGTEFAHGIYLRDGFGLGRVLAVGGERVTFEGATFRVNGVSHPALPYMPASGELVVDENHWFIWPDLAIRGNNAASVAPGLMLQMSVVSKEQVVGKPFKRWFWRRQISS